MADGDDTAGRLAIGLLQDVTAVRRLQIELRGALERVRCDRGE